MGTASTVCRVPDAVRVDLHVARHLARGRGGIDGRNAGAGREPACNPPHPTCYLTFQHPCTGQAITLPLRLPIDSTPRIEHRYNRLIYNYGSDSVEIEFLTDGSADVIYNSGLRRSPYR